MELFKIRSRWTGKVLFETEAVSLKAALEIGVQKQARLSGALLDGARLSGARLSGAQLSGALLDGARLDGALLDGALLDGARLSGAQLSGALLSGAQLSGARLSGARLSGAQLDGAQLDGAIFGLENVDWTVRTVERLGAPGVDYFPYLAFLVERDGKREWLIQAGCRLFIGIKAARKHWDPAKHREPWKARWLRRRLADMVKTVKDRESSK